jgi:hypothetical protein
MGCNCIGIRIYFFLNFHQFKIVKPNINNISAGQAVAFPCQEVRLPAGDHRFGMDGLNFPAGLYTVQVQTEKASSVLRIVKMY